MHASTRITAFGFLTFLAPKYSQGMDSEQALIREQMLMREYECLSGSNQEYGNHFQYYHKENWIQGTVTKE